MASSLQLAKGPFTLIHGGTTLADVEDVSLTYDIESSDHSSIQGHTYTILGAHKVTVEVPFLFTDVPALAAVLPQHFVANGQTLSSGETVNHADGAIDIVPTQCAEDEEVTDDLLVVSCNGHVLRILDAKPEFGGMEIDDNLRKVTVTFNGQSTTGTVQFYKEGAVTIVS